MSSLSVGKAWDETRAVLARDGRLIVPIVLALSILPFVISDVAMGGGRPAEAGTFAGLIFVAALLISVVGQLAIQWLAVRHGVQVRDAIRRGLARTPVAFAAVLVVIIPAALIVAPIMAPIMANPEDPPAGSLALLLLALLLLLIPGARLCLTSPVAAAEDLGPVGTLKRSWQLTRGSTAKLYGTILLIVIAIAIVSFVVTVVVGSFVLIVLGSPAPWNAAALAGSLINQLIMAVITVPLTILFARIYAQLSAGQPSVPEVKREG